MSRVSLEELISTTIPVKPKWLKLPVTALVQLVSQQMEQVTMDSVRLQKLAVVEARQFGATLSLVVTEATKLRVAIIGNLQRLPLMGILAMFQPAS